MSDKQKPLSAEERWDLEQDAARRRREAVKARDRWVSKVTAGPLVTVREAAERNGIEVWRALKVLQSGNYAGVTGPDDQIGEVAQEYLASKVGPAHNSSPIDIKPSAIKAKGRRLLPYWEDGAGNSQQGPRFSGMALQVSDKLAAALALTPHRPDAKPIGEEFSVAIAPKLGPMALIRMVGSKWSAHDENGDELDLDDARVPVLRNIAFGACDLLATPHETGKRRIVEEPDEALPVKLIKPTHCIKVEVGADFRPLVIEIIEGKRSYETATTEAIFVRGHWTHQPCGPARSERKLIWRQPHYRGRGARGGRTYELEAAQ
jgi:hypothetical protein